jgi:hypothetical protein
MRLSKEYRIGYVTLTSSGLEPTDKETLPHSADNSIYTKTNQMRSFFSLCLTTGLDKTSDPAAAPDSAGLLIKQGVRPFLCLLSGLISNIRREIIGIRDRYRQ